MAHVQSLARGQGAERIVRSSQEVFDFVPVDTALAAAGVTVTEIAHGETQSRESLRQEIIAAGLGITGVDYAIAETGSVIVLPRAGLSRLVSLVPPVHIALVRPGDVIESLDDLFLLRKLEYLRNGGDMGRYLNFITGPSRTADIEQTLVVGVHGPKEAHMLLLG
jgi:L-lactate dehydrogenase complex protein LldG